MSGTPKIVLGDKSPKIFNQTDDEIEVGQTIFDYYEYAYENEEFWNYYAITLTIPKNTSDMIKKSDRKDKSVQGYFEYLLKQLNFNGVWVVEHTKKGVEHLHGIVYTSEIVKNNIPKFKRYINKKLSYSYDLSLLDYPYQHVVKDITSRRAMTGWCRYMTKNCIHKTVLEYLLPKGAGLEASANESYEEW